MSADTAGLGLKEPEIIDWENFNPGGKYTPPPVPVDSEGKAIHFVAQLPADLGDRVGVNDNGYRTFEAGPLRLVKNGNGVDGTEIRFYTVSVQKFTNKDGQPINVNSAGKLLRAAGVTAKPQTTAQYEQAMKAARGRTIPIAIDWVAKDKDTGFEIKGYENFPLEYKTGPNGEKIPTGKRTPVVRATDTLPDGRQIPCEIMFANARVRYVADPRK